nr:gfo/Idh/MocA family oxidoreductase [bacterium]
EAGKKQLRVYGVDGSIADYTVPDLEGEHGGSDGLLLKARIRGMEEDPLYQLATSRSGAMSCMIGAAANISRQTERIVSISEELGE